MSQDKKSSGSQKVLDFIEVVGNKLPHPAILFVIMSVIVIILSHIFSLMGTSVTYYGIDTSTLEIGEVTVDAVSLLSAEGIRHIFTSAVGNFTSFAPLGVVVVAMIGVGVAEGSGLISTLIRKLVLATPQKALTFSIVFIGVLSSIATDAGYLVLIPMAAAIFHSSGRHPIAGLAAAFAGVAGGFGASILITPIDAILTGLTNEAVALLDPTYQIEITANYYFAAISTFLVAIVVTLVTEKIVEPRLGKYTGDAPIDKSEGVTAEERRGLKFALIGFILTVVFLTVLSAPSNAVLRNPETGTLITNSPFMDGLIFIIMLIFLVPGIAYGYGANTIKDTKDIVKHATTAMSSLSAFFVLAFVIGQFISYFNFSGLGTILAVNGANFLDTIGLTGLALILAFIVFAAILNLFMGSASAKWAIMAPIFVPMLMQMGISPAMTQAAYRVGDSSTTIITPLMSYFALIVVFAEKYDKKVGIGTLISTMIPYSIFIGLSWTALLIVWYIIGLPLGPDAYILMPTL